MVSGGEKAADHAFSELLVSFSLTHRQFELEALSLQVGTGIGCSDDGDTATIHSPRQPTNSIVQSSCSMILWSQVKTVKLNKHICQINPYPLGIVFLHNIRSNNINLLFLLCTISLAWSKGFWTIMGIHNVYRLAVIPSYNGNILFIWPAAIVYITNCYRPSFLS